MKIAEVCTFSKGICGVFARVKEESKRLKEDGHEVMIFSSNFVKGTNEITEDNDEVYGIPIKRFSARKLGGESFMSWDFDKFEKEIIKFNPDVIIAHSYRHSHTLKSLKIAKKLNCKVFLVTHAPFGRSSSRNLIQKIAVKFYDIFIGRRTIKKFDKVIAITHWEIPYLKDLGLNENKIVYIPNGIPEEFFN